MDLWPTLKHAVRTTVRRPLFSLVAIASLAVGIGASTALFSVANVLVLRPVPGVPGWDRAIEIGRTDSGRGFDTFSYPELEDIAQEVSALEEVAGYELSEFSVGTEGGGVRHQGAFVSPRYFAALGLVPQAGRFFESDSDLVGNPLVAVVSHRFWQERMDGASDVIGSTVRINRRPFTVVGVTAESFAGHFVGWRTDLIVPFAAAIELGSLSTRTIEHRGSSWLSLIGRLSPGSTTRDVDTQLSGLYSRLQQEYPRFTRDRSARAMAAGPLPGGGRVAAIGFLGALGVLVALVLLATCSNVAGMFLARAAERERELAVRVALGSGRGSLVTHLLGEVVVVFLLGGIGGLIAAQWGLSLVDLNALPVPVDIALDLRPNARVLGAGLGVSLIAGLLFGIAPAFQATRRDVVHGLKAEAAGGRRASLLRRGLAGAQVGVSVVLLVAAGLFLRSLQTAAAIDPGFEASGAFATAIDLEVEGFEAPEGGILLRDLRRALSSIPGVTAAAVATDLPLDLSIRGSSIRLEGDDERLIGVEFSQVSPGYVQTLGLTLISGRDFSEDDVAGSTEVALVSRTLVEEVWPGQNPLGRHFELLTGTGATIEVVGVVEDIRNESLMNPTGPFVYRPIAQEYGSSVTFMVRSDLPFSSVAPAMRASMLEVDPGISVSRVVSVEDLAAVGVLPQRIGAGVATLLGAVALFLATLGVYGVVAFIATQRTREVGIRMALGANRSRIVRQMFRRGIRLTGPGLIVGGLLAAGVGEVLGSQGILLGVSPWDPLTYGVVASVLAASIALASGIPARRASAVEPSEALRHD